MSTGIALADAGVDETVAVESTAEADCAAAGDDPRSQPNRAASSDTLTAERKMVRECTSGIYAVSRAGKDGHARRNVRVGILVGSARLATHTN